MSTKIQTPILFNSKNCNLHIVVLLSNPFNFSLSLSSKLVNNCSYCSSRGPPACWLTGSPSSSWLSKLSVSAKHILCYAIMIFFLTIVTLHSILWKVLSQSFMQHLNFIMWLAMVQLFLRCYAHTALNPFFLLLLRISCENTTIRFESWKIIFFSYSSCVNHRI